MHNGKRVLGWDMDGWVAFSVLRFIVCLMLEGGDTKTRVIRRGKIHSGERFRNDRHAWRYGTTQLLFCCCFFFTFGLIRVCIAFTWIAVHLWTRLDYTGGVAGEEHKRDEHNNYLLPDTVCTPRNQKPPSPYSPWRA
jgi:hypothetical protein